MSLMMARFNKLVVFTKQDLTDRRQSVEVQDSGSGLEGSPPSGNRQRSQAETNYRSSTGSQPAMESLSLNLHSGSVKPGQHQVTTHPRRLGGPIGHTQFAIATLWQPKVP